MSDAFQEFGIGAGDDNISDKRETYKGKRNEVHRLSLAWWDGFEKEDFDESNLDQSSPKFIAAKRVYIEGCGYVIVTSPEITKLAGKDSKKAVATIVVKWPTNSKGSIDADSLKKGRYEVLPFIFSPDKYSKLTIIHEGAGAHFGKHDILSSIAGAKEEKYQDLNFTQVSDNILRAVLKKKGAMAKDIMDKVREVADEIQRTIGRVMTPAEIREKLGQDEGVSSPVDDSGIASGADVDGLLDDMDV